jgi:hypothetical protein
MKRKGGGKIGLADSARVRKKNPSGVLEKVSSPFRGHMTPTGNERANGISEREPNNEADCESDFEVRCHVAVTSSRGASSRWREDRGCLAELLEWPDTAPRRTATRQRARRQWRRSLRVGGGE